MSLMNLVMVEREYLLKISLEDIPWTLWKVFPLSRAVAGHCPKKYSTVSSDSSQFGHILVRALLMV